MNSENKKVGFLLHPRNFRDFYNKYPFAKMVPEWLLEKITRYLPPLTVSRITGLKDREGNKIEGYVLSLPLIAKTMIENRELARKKVEDAVKKANNLGIGILALGGLTASLSKGGLDVAEKNDVGVTTGRAYTVKIVTDYVDYVCNNFDINKKQINIGIVGAAGSIGAGCAFKLAKNGYSQFTLVDIERKLDRVKQHANELNETNIDIVMDHQLHVLEEAHIIIAATNAPEALISSGDLTPGTFIVNDAQPSDVADEVYSRGDVAVIEGGVVTTPGISCNLKMGLHDKHDNFCCAVEAFILAQNGHYDNYSIGYLSLENIEKLERLSEGSKFELSAPQNIHGYVSEKKLNDVATKLKERLI